ncbi:MAG: hypothetical protein HYW37_01000 [Candidatus Colwellbacteria bacterium]|nr:hypothetical protein [Candidatus Colwellbacteria bacterium]
MERKYFDALVLISLFSVTSVLILLLNINALISQILYLVTPSLYLLIRYPLLIRRVLLFALPLGIALSVILQVFAEKNGIWYAKFLLPRLYNVPLDVFFWYPFWLLLVVILYEVFIDFKRTNKKLSKNYKWLIIAIFFLAVVFTLWLKLGQVSIGIPYATILSLPVILPIIYILLEDHKLLPKLITFSFILLPFNIIYELIGIKLQHWHFAGDYIASVNILGLGIPLEEIVLWIMLGPASVAAYYEMFVDDLK